MAKRRAYDLRERTARFGEAAIAFAGAVPRNAVTLPLIRQLVRSGTSVGANNSEADEAVSRKDFRNKIGICRKEAAEAKYWLRMIAAAQPALKEKAGRVWKEANELHLIFAKSFRTASREAPRGPCGGEPSV